VAIRPGRSEAADKLFTYIALAVVGAGIVGGGIYMVNKQSAEIGLTTDADLFDQNVSVGPGRAERFPRLQVPKRGNTKISYRMELNPTESDLCAGLVRPGTKLEKGNTAWSQKAGDGILYVRQGRTGPTMRDDIQPGVYDLVVENRTDKPAKGRVMVKLLYEPNK